MKTILRIIQVTIMVFQLQRHLEQESLKVLFLDVKKT